MDYPFQNKVLTLVAYASCSGYPIEIHPYSFHIDHVFNVNDPIVKYSLENGYYRKVYLGRYVAEKEEGKTKIIATDLDIRSTIVELPGMSPTAYELTEPGNGFRMCGVYVSSYYNSPYGVNIPHFLETDKFNEEVRRLLSNVKEPYCYPIETGVNFCPDTIQNASKLFNCEDKIVIPYSAQEQATTLYTKYLKPVYVVASPEKFCKTYNPIYTDIQKSEPLKLSPQFEAVKLMMAEMMGVPLFPLDLVPTFGHQPRLVKTIGKYVVVAFNDKMLLGNCVLSYLRELAPLVRRTTIYMVDDLAIQLASKTASVLGTLKTRSANSLVKALYDAINNGSYRFVVPYCDKYVYNGKAVVCG